MPTRTARTGWTGTLEQGVGKVELTSSKIGTYEVSFPKRVADDAGEPPARRSSSRRSLGLLRHGAVRGDRPGRRDPAGARCAGRRDARARPGGCFKLTGIKLTVRGEVDGLNAEQFAQAAQAAKKAARSARRSPAWTSPWTPPLRSR